MPPHDRQQETFVGADTIDRIKEAVAALHGEQISFLQTMVQTPSVTGHEGAVQAIIASAMRDDGLETDVWEPDVALLAPYAEHITGVPSYDGRPNVVGVLHGDGQGRSLILNAHVDTVEAGDPRLWSTPPFGAEIRNGLLYGRGACDMKAGFATHLFAIRALRRAGFRPRGDVIIESTISEEDGGAGALAAILRGYTADAAIITEPTRLAIIAAHGGSLMFRLRVPGVSAHACVRDEGVSAVEKFFPLLEAMLAFERRRNESLAHPLYADIANKVPINIGVVQAGTWPSSVPDELVAEGRAGLMPGEELHQFRDELRAAILAAADRDPWLRDHPPTIEWLTGQFAPSEVPVDSPLIRLLGDAHKASIGTVPPIEAATYGADMRHFVVTGGIPCVMYGAGDVRLAHHVDESVALEDVRIATTTIAEAIAEWCGVDALN